MVSGHLRPSGAGVRGAVLTAGAGADGAATLPNTPSGRATEKGLTLTVSCPQMTTCPFRFQVIG